MFLHFAAIKKLYFTCIYLILNDHALFDFKIQFNEFQMIDREGKREKLLEGKNRERKLREKLEGRNLEILNSPRSEIINNVITEAINSPRNEIVQSPRGDRAHSPRGDRMLSPRGEISGEKVFNFEEKLDVVENGANEFNSVFDENQKGEEDDVAEPSNEKVLFDMQFCDVLYTVLDAVKQQH